MRKLGKDALANLKLDTSCQIDLGSSVTAVDSSNYKTNIVWGFNHDNPIQDDNAFRQQKSVVTDATESEENSDRGKLYFDYRKVKNGELILQKRLADGTTAQNVISTETTSSTWKNTENERTSIKKIYIPYGVVNLTQYCFAGTGVNEIKIPDSVTIISAGAFSSSKLKEITTPHQIKTISAYAFSSSDVVVANLAKSTPLTSIAVTFYSCKSLEEVHLPEELTTIGQDTFKLCNSLKSIRLPEKLTTIGQEAFKYCTSLKEIVIPASVTSIDSTAFSACQNLKTVTVKKSTDSIKNAPWGATNAEIMWEE